MTTQGKPLTTQADQDDDDDALVLCTIRQGGDDKRGKNRSIKQQQELILNIDDKAQNVELLTKQDEPEPELIEPKTIEPNIEYPKKSDEESPIVESSEDGAPDDLGIITIVETDIKEEEVKFAVYSRDFNSTELFIFNQEFTHDTLKIPVIQETPFIIIDLIKRGIIPIFNDEYAFETRVIVGQPYYAISENDYKILATHYKKIIASKNKTKKTSASLNVDELIGDAYEVPYDILETRIIRVGSERAINVVGFLIPKNFYRQEVIKNLIQRCYIKAEKRDNSVALLSRALQSVLKVEHLSRITLGVPFNLEPFYNVSQVRMLYYIIKMSEQYYDSPGCIMESSAILNKIRQRAEVLYKKRLQPASHASLEFIKPPADLMEFCHSVGVGVFQTPFMDALYGDLMNRREGSNLDAFINIVMLHNKEYQAGIAPQYHGIGRFFTQDMLILSQYEYIYKILFGIQKLRQIHLKNKTIQTSFQFINALSDTERSSVLAEYQRQDNFWKAYINNKCPHVNVIIDFYKSISVEVSRDNYKRIKEFIKYEDIKKKPNMMVKCRLCNFDLICPHRVVIAEHMAHDITQAVRYRSIHADLNRFRDEDITEDVRYYYCKICGEQLYERDESYGAMRETIPPPESDRRAMWSEAGLMINKFCKIEYAIDVPSTIEIMIKIIYPIILEMSQKYYIRETSEQEYETIIRVAMASYLDLLTLSTKRKIVFDAKRFEKSLSLRERDKFIKFFREIKDKILQLRIEERHLFRERVLQTRDIVATYLVHDPTFYFNAFIVYDLFINEQIVTELSEKIKNFSYDVFDLVPLETIRLDLIEKNLLQIKNKIFYSSEYLKALDFIGYILQVLIYNKNVMFYKNEKLWNKVINIAEIDIGTYNPNDPSITDKEILNIINRLQLIVSKNREMTIRKPISVRVINDTYRFRKYPIKLGEIFDENGIKHIWDRYVYGNKLLKLSEISRKENDILYDDMYSTITKTYRKNAVSISEDKVRASLLLFHLKSNFFNFYTNKCPVGGVHEKNGDINNHCKKCGIHGSMTDAERMQYMNKYLGVYEKENEYRKQREEEETTKAEITKVVAQVEELPDTLPDEYAPDEKIMRTVATIVGVSYYFIRHLGGIQGHLFENIESGATTPPIPKTLESYRLYLLDAYAKQYITYKSRNGFISDEYKVYLKNLEIAKRIGDARRAIYYIIMFICRDFLTFHQKNADEAIEIMKSILYNDSLLCKNSKSIYEEVDPIERIHATADYPEKLSEDNTGSLSYEGFDFEGFSSDDSVP